jgi:hypothetical protein
MQKLLWQIQWGQALDFIDPRVARLRRLAIKRRFIQRLPNSNSSALSAADFADLAGFFAFIVS